MMQRWRMLTIPSLKPHQIPTDWEDGHRYLAKPITKTKGHVTHKPSNEKEMEALMTDHHRNGFATSVQCTVMPDHAINCEKPPPYTTGSYKL